MIDLDNLFILKAQVAQENKLFFVVQMSFIEHRDDTVSNTQ